MASAGAVLLTGGWTEQQRGVHIVSDQSKRDTSGRSAHDAAIADDNEGTTRKGLFGRFNARVNDAITASRGNEPRNEVTVAAQAVAPPADEVALRRARPAKSSSAKMIIPDGATVDGSITASGETEIAGQINGDITVDGRLYLSASAVVSGNVRAVACIIEGTVHGKTECSESLELGRTGHLHSDAVAGKRFALAGQVDGNVTSGGMLNLVQSGRVTGNIRTPRLVMEEGAVFNGHCAMRANPRQSLPQQPQQMALES